MQLPPLSLKVLSSGRDRRVCAGALCYCGPGEGASRCVVACVHCPLSLPFISGSVAIRPASRASKTLQLQGITALKHGPLALLYGVIVSGQKREPKVTREFWGGDDKPATHFTIFIRGIERDVLRCSKLPWFLL